MTSLFRVVAIICCTWLFKLFCLFLSFKHATIQMKATEMYILVVLVITLRVHAVHVLG